MNAKEIVLKSFPGAQAFLDEDSSDDWCIWDDTVEIGPNSVLGVGSTAENAWENASRNSRVSQ